MIRSVTLGNLWALRRKPRNQMVLHNESLLVQPYHPFWFVVRCILQGTGRDREAMVYRDGDVLATAHAQGIADRPEQTIRYLAVHGPGNQSEHSDYDIWYRLLERLCVNAGHQEIQRLYTSVWSQQQAEIGEIFRQLGFQAYTQNAVLQLSGPDWDQGTTLYPMRVQLRRDAWAVHKLYGAITPPLVQQAEARSPRTWMPPHTRGWQRVRRRAWVSGSEDELGAYLHILSGPEAYVFTLLIHPEVRDHVTDVVRFGLTQLPDSRPVYLVLREYHQEFIDPLQSLGFQLAGQQALLVKSMVVRMRRPLVAPALKASIWGTQVIIPRISTPREDSNTYVRTTRSHE